MKNGIIAIMLLTDTSMSLGKFKKGGCKYKSTAAYNQWIMNCCRLYATTDKQAGNYSSSLKKNNNKEFKTGFKIKNF